MDYYIEEYSRQGIHGPCTYPVPSPIFPPRSMSSLTKPLRTSMLVPHPRAELPRRTISALAPAARYSDSLHQRDERRGVKAEHGEEHGEAHPAVDGEERFGGPLGSVAEAGGVQRIHPDVAGGAGGDCWWWGEK